MAVDVQRHADRGVPETLANETTPRNRPDDYVFQNQVGGPLDASKFRKMWRETRARIGLDEAVRLYDLRHAHACALLSARVDPYTVARRLGNSPAVLLNTYAHLLPGMQAPAVAAVRTLFQTKSGK